MDDCARSAPVCTTQEPWKEADTCCPQSCYDNYKAVRLGGKSVRESLVEVYLSGSCFPGVNK
jgi:hypothetical protein